MGEKGVATKIYSLPSTFASLVLMNCVCTNINFTNSPN